MLKKMVHKMNTAASDKCHKDNVLDGKISSTIQSDLGDGCVCNVIMLVW